MNNAQKPQKEEVIREFPPLGFRYRVRVLANPKSKQKTLDIREYVSSETGFEGFTRRGIRLSDRAELDLLRDILKEILEQSIV